MITDKISVIVPVYNRENFIDNCINSVLHQDGVAVELILIDDGSKDRSLEICRTYEEKYDNVKVIHQDNAGISHARNIGLDNATGDYICFLDDDDIMTPCGLKSMLEAMKKYDVDFVAGNFERVGENGEFHSPSNMPEFVKNRAITTDEYWEASFDKEGHFVFIVNWAKLYKKKIWEKLRFKDDLRKAEDEYVMADILQQCRMIYVTDFIVYKQTMTRDSITRGKFSLVTLKAPETKLVTTSKLFEICKYKYAVKKWGIACGEIIAYKKLAKSKETKAEIIRLYDYSCELGKKLFRYMDISKKIKYLGYRLIAPYIRYL